MCNESRNCETTVVEAACRHDPKQEHENVSLVVFVCPGGEVMEVVIPHTMSLGRVCLSSRLILLFGMLAHPPSEYGYGFTRSTFWCGVGGANTQAEWQMTFV